MTPQQFQQIWERVDGDRLVAFPQNSLSDVRIQDDARAFLTKVGLPADATPFLNFKPPNGGLLQRVSVVWHQSSAFARYRVIGANGSGDPVCIDEEAAGQIVYLNHDDRFQRVLMASSVFTLAECLIQFRDFIVEAGGILDPIAPERFGPLLERLNIIDPAVVGNDGYWQQQCKELQA